MNIFSGNDVHRVANTSPDVTHLKVRKAVEFGFTECFFILLHHTQGLIYHS